MAFIGNQAPPKLISSADVAPQAIGSINLAPTAVFDVGTRLGFNQTVAPVGWTKDTSAAMNDSIMRIVTGNVGQGGSNAFSTFNGQSTVGATTLSIAQMPSHDHSPPNGYTWASQPSGADGTFDGSTRVTGYDRTAVTGNVTNTGGGQSHNHTIITSIKYNDFIVASKN